MNKLSKKLAAVGVCICMAATSLTGCGAKADTTIATLDGENVEYGVASFMVRYSQASMQSMYGSYMGTDYWQNYGEQTKTSTMDSLQQMLVLEKHMDEYNVTVSDEEKEAISAAAKEFMETNEKSVTKALAVTEKTVNRVLTLYTIQNKMSEAIVADVDTEVSDEEAAQKTIKYGFFSTADSKDADGNTAALTDDEKTAIKEQAQQVLDALKAGDDLSTALTAVDEEKTVSEASYGTDNGDLPDEVKEAADKLEDGEYTDSVIETDTGYYVVQMVSTFDEVATESQKETIVSQRKSDKFDEVYEAWKEEVTFTIDDKVLAKLTFIDIYEVKTTEAETEAETSAETNAETSSETSAETSAETSSETSAEVTEAGTEATTE